MKRDKELTITLRTPKGTEWEIKAIETKLEAVKRNAKQLGYKIVRIA